MMDAKTCSRKEWDAWLNGDCVLVTIEFDGRITRRVIPKTEMYVARDPVGLVGQRLAGPIMGVLDGGQHEDAR